jgi:HEAT repeat protein
MREIYRGKFSTSHHLLALYDVADNDSFPEIGTGTDSTYFGPKGVLITVATDDDIQVTVYTGEGTPPGVLVGTGTIEGGDKGLFIGSPLADLDLLAWPPGPASVSVYLDTDAPYEAKQVTFVLNALGAAAEARVSPKPTGDEQVARRVEEVINSLKDHRSASQAATTLSRLGKAAVPPLIAALQSDHTGARQMAAQALGTLKDKRAVGPLLQALTDNDSDLRRYAALSLGQIGDRRALAPLIAALSDRHSQVREMAAWALGMLHDPEAVEPLITTLTNRRESFLVQEFCIRALGEIRDPRGLDPVFFALRHGIDHVRHAAMQALLSFGKISVPPLVEMLKDRDAGVRRWAAITLGGLRSKQSTEALLGALHDKDPKVAGSAASALGKHRSPRAVEPLIAALQHRSNDVRYWAADALGMLGYADALPALQQMQSDSRKTSWGATLSEAADRSVNMIQYKNKI